jgi:hypothetical protein
VQSPPAELPTHPPTKLLRKTIDNLMVDSVDGRGSRKILDRDEKLDSHY